MRRPEVVEAVLDGKFGIPIADKCVRGPTDLTVGIPNLEQWSRAGNDAEQQNLIAGVSAAHLSGPAQLCLRV